MITIIIYLLVGVGIISVLTIWLACMVGWATGFISRSLRDVAFEVINNYFERKDEHITKQLRAGLKNDFLVH